MVKYSPKTKEELEKLVSDESVNLGDIDTSAITDMSYLFAGSNSKRTDFSGIEKWDTSKVTNMDSMFYNSFFNHNISGWDTSSVDNMSNMFSSSFFNQNINDWNVSSVTDMFSMFANTPFNQPLDKWNVSNVENMEGMFSDSSFGQNINDWSVSKVTNMSRMFEGTPFNQPLDKWNVASVLSMVGMFANAKQFNQNIGMWDISRVERMESMFLGAESFNQNLDNWIPYKRVEIACIFSFCPIAYNSPEWFWHIHDRFFEWWDSADNDWEEVMESESDGTYIPKDLDELRNLVANKFIHLGNIDTSAIDDMDELFSDSDRVIFDGIEKWDTSNVTYMGYMFSGAKHFNHNINDWNVSSVEGMESMFNYSLFNQPLDKWNVSKVKNMPCMFESTPFNQSLDNWNVSKVEDMSCMFEGTPLEDNPPKWYKTDE